MDNSLFDPKHRNNTSIEFSHNQKPGYPGKDELRETAHRELERKGHDESDCRRAYRKGGKVESMAQSQNEGSPIRRGKTMPWDNKTPVKVKSPDTRIGKGKPIHGAPFPTLAETNKKCGGEVKKKHKEHREEEKHEKRSRHAGGGMAQKIRLGKATKNGQQKDSYHGPRSMKETM